MIDYYLGLGSKATPVASLRKGTRRTHGGSSLLPFQSPEQGESPDYQSGDGHAENRRDEEDQEELHHRVAIVARSLGRV